MEENEPYLIPKNKSKNKKVNKKNYEPDSESENNEEENDSLSDIKNITSKKRTNSEDSDLKSITKEEYPVKKNNFQKDIKNIQQNDDSKSESLNIKITKGKYDSDTLLKKLQKMEKELKEKENTIKDLKKEITEKDNKIKLITKTNNKLKQSLTEFSKKVDEKLFNNKNILNNFRKSKYNIKNYNLDDELKKKELDNAMNIIKILKNDNHRLQTAIDNYEKNNKLKDLENINKIKEDENINLENQIKLLKKELNNYNICLKKCKIYENQIDILNKENKSFKDNNKMLKNKLNNQKNKSSGDLLDNNRNKGYISPKRNDNYRQNDSFLKKSRNKYNSNSDRYHLNNNFNSLNNKDGYIKLNNRTSNLHQSIGSLPTIINKNSNILKNNTPMGLHSYKKNYENTNDILKTFFNQDDIEIINRIFKSNLNGLEDFKLKLCIINKSKQTLNNKYNLEIKKYNERIISAQEQIEYLNNKVRESEVNYRVLQTQLNEFNIEKKLLLKKIKKLKENLSEKDYILKLNLVGEDMNNEKLKNKKKGQNNLFSDKNSEEDGSSKIANEDSNENNNDSDKADNKTENSQSSIEK